MVLMSILGIDEVGRGSLAGPVYLSGVKLNNDFPLYTYSYNSTGWNSDFEQFQGIRDSKQLSQKKREKVFLTLTQMELDYLLLSASAELIDRFGIGVCLSHMVFIIVNQLQADRNIIDGKIKILDEYDPVLLTELEKENDLELSSLLCISLEKNNRCIQVERENKADDKYLSIAMASCLAKVTRDKLMSELSNNYPHYDWLTNKGYGTVKHRAAIQQDPVNKHLRQTFLTKILAKK